MDEPNSHKKPLISVVSPVYKAELIVDELVSLLTKNLREITEDFEIILVEDGSPDKSWEKIRENCKKDKRVKGVKLSRNFGQHYAITAGLDRSLGEWVIVMDCDLQDRPEEIVPLYKKAREGYDLVLARRARRQDNFDKKFYSFLFYKIFSYLSGVRQDNTISNFGIYNRKVIDAINKIREPMRAFSPMVKWVGFNSSTIDVYHDKRFEGKSSYNWYKLLNLAMDISLAYSDKPLKLVAGAGLAISLGTLFLALFFFILGIVRNEILSVYFMMLVSFWFLGGVIILTLGVIGLYISKTFESVKGRPLYIIDQIENIN